MGCEDRRSQVTTEERGAKKRRQLEISQLKQTVQHLFLHRHRVNLAPSSEQPEISDRLLLKFQRCCGVDCRYLCWMLYEKLQALCSEAGLTPCLPQYEYTVRLVEAR